MARDTGIRAKLSLLATLLLLGAQTGFSAVRFDFPTREPGRCQAAVGVSAMPGGALELAASGGRRLAQGSLVWRAERSDIALSVVELEAVSQIPAGCRLSWDVRAVRSSDGHLTDWQTLAPGVRLPLEAPADAVQLRVTLGSSNPAASPLVTRVTLVCYSAEVVAPLASSSNEECPVGGNGGGAATYPEPPDISGPIVAVEPPPIVGRETWGSRAPREAYEALNPGKLTVHHSSEPRAAHCRGCGTIRGIQAYHMHERGWNDIAYHYLIAPDGTVYQGRPEGANGSHSRPNRHKLGICVLGNFNRGEERISPSARASLVRLLAYLAGKYGISSRAIYGHRDFNSTDCPGDTLYGALSALRADVERTIRRAEQPHAASQRAATGAAQPGREL
ncbi:MAG: N-acetylmuramoyl-L-alanine amidase [Candidatus Wallbacteria bacterium]|nr:N-acetylmuramoyl-L-alanine amidase [Candidatus Wallbacteria bacterium]